MYTHNNKKCIYIFLTAARLMAGAAIWLLLWGMNYDVICGHHHRGRSGYDANRKKHESDDREGMVGKQSLVDGLRVGKCARMVQSAIVRLASGVMCNVDCVVVGF